ncbi:MAG: hypothetical protein ABJP45_11555 [Cyclobacteriaceae bacterium]
MKKNILIITLFVFVVLFALYGSIKASEAEKNLIVAQQQQVLAQENAAEAMRQSELAIARAVEAEEARAALEQCQNKKP